MMDSPHANDSSGAPGSKLPSANGSTPVGGKVDMRDVVGELTERAQAISREAGGRVANAMKDVIGTGAGIAGFAIESARDLVQFLVRRGQITVEEGDKLIREAETHRKRSPTTSKTAVKSPAKTSAKVPAKAAAKPAGKSTKPAANAKSSAKSTPAKKKK